MGAWRTGSTARAVFGATAEEYERWRPTLPAGGGGWLLPPGATRVADVGAGTGKLTGPLLARGVEVAAVEPDPAMLAVLRREHPAAVPYLAGAEALPMPDASVDAVLAGQAWHWFPHARAVPRCAGCCARAAGSAWSGTARTRATSGSTTWPGSTRTPPAGTSSPPRRTTRSRSTGCRRTSWSGRASRGCGRSTGRRLRGRLLTHSAFAVLDPPERDRLVDAMVAVVDAEAERRGTPTVLLRQSAHCARWRPGR